MGSRAILREYTKESATIASGQALSNAIQLGGHVIASIHMPSTWTAAALTFQASDDGGTTWRDVYDDAGTEVTIASAAVVASRAIVNKTVLEQLAGLTTIRLRSGVTALPVNQAAARILVVGLKG